MSPLSPSYSTEPIPVRRLAAGNYETLDGRFRLYDRRCGKYRWGIGARAGWDEEPDAAAWLSDGELCWTTLRAVRVRLASAYAEERRRRPRTRSALAEEIETLCV